METTGLKRWQFVLLLASALIALALAPAGVRSSTANVHGAVYSWANAHPGQPVPLIIQTTTDPDAIGGKIERAGGAVNRQFNIIQSVQAEVPASFVSTLAAEPGVAWVSLDAPVHSTG